MKQRLPAMDSPQRTIDVYIMQECIMQTKHDSLLATGMNGVTIADHALTILHKSHGMKPMKSPAEMVLRHFS
jgi:hypothetical protein